MNKIIKDFNESTLNHVIEHTKYSDTLEKYSYHKSDKSSFYWMDFIIDRNKLIVTGDCGDAIFEWSSKIDLNFLTECGFDYFLGKCRASEYGYKFLVWDSDVCEKNVRSFFADNFEIEFDKNFIFLVSHPKTQDDPLDEEDYDNDKYGDKVIEELNDKFYYLISDISKSMESKEEWTTFLSNNNSELEKLTGYENLSSDLWGMGDTPNIRAIYMWQALKNIKKLLEVK
jgi:hypothetical protein